MSGAQAARHLLASTATRVVAAMAVMSVAHATSAQKPGGPAHEVASMDVAGVRLGMPKEAAEMTLRAASYRCERFGNAPSFDEQVQDEVIRRKGGTPSMFGARTATAQLNCTGPAGETLRIDFAQVRTGDIVRAMLLRADPRRIDQAAMRRQVIGKYGVPTVADADAGTWCNSGQRCATLLVPQEGRYPQFAVSTRDGLWIAASRGTDASTAAAAEIQVEAARRAPAAPRASF